jgi:hypothetical protein
MTIVNILSLLHLSFRLESLAIERARWNGASAAEFSVILRIPPLLYGEKIRTFSQIFSR